MNVFQGKLRQFIWDVAVNLRSIKFLKYADNIVR